MNDHRLLSAHLFRPETLKALRRELMHVQKIADRWALGSLKKVRELEKKGELLPRLREQAELESETLLNARTNWPFPDTPDSELLKMHEIDPLP